MTAPDHGTLRCPRIMEWTAIYPTGMHESPSECSVLLWGSSPQNLTKVSPLFNLGNFPKERVTQIDEWIYPILLAGSVGGKNPSKRIAQNASNYIK